ncbi:biopolymer transporter ExbD [Maribacter sp. PR1]|uniref:Biopolymer transporter ExbD n=1 Tax=Maribacter cobaltidurans TaxID=1178778 RepID=A0ABU7IPI5_9FLAO|nr:MULTISPECIES: biopolymer transporter ExbD [Maribacter]MDC6387475.1 biopolymer transporter ExbD [Maribacter sp. PR1]MEE1974862.1 biopolymer transporter ExbD [Maribacter cobaltidurans]
MAKHRTTQEVNAGSMADIAFLLLIFFLVTASIETDVGLDRMLPQKNDDHIADIKQRNLFEISLNNTDDIMANGEVISVESLRQKVMEFIDNGESNCDYCRGIGTNELSEHPGKAIVSIKTQRNTSYPIYVTVQNEVLGAYNQLRDRESLRLFKVPFKDMEVEYYLEETNEERKQLLKERIEVIREMYPQKILEPETINN